MYSATSESSAPEAKNQPSALKVARVLARALAVSTPEADQLPLAQAFCYHVVAAWWAEITHNDAKFPLRPLSSQSKLHQLPDPAAASAHGIGSAVAAYEPEVAAYWVGVTYTSMLPQAYRSLHGVYYTPPQITARLIDQAKVAGVDWTSCRVLDPAYGGGAFLAPVARRILDALPDVTPAILVENIGNRLHGYEIDPFAAWLSQVALDAVMLPVCRKAGRRLPEVVSVCDSLQCRIPREPFDLVIGNPPYGRVKLLEEDRARYRRSLFGHANLYGLFTDMALAHVKRGGVVAYVTPTGFLAGEYFKNLRATIAAEAFPVTADFVALRKGVFEDVLQETLLTTYRRRGEKVPAQAFEIMPDNGGGLQVTPTGSFVLPDDPSQPWLLPRTPAQASLIVSLQSMAHRLQDWGYAVSTGPLVWNRSKSQIQTRPGRDRLPLIWAESVTSDGQFIFRAEKKNHKPYFEPKAGDDWLITREPCVLLQRTTATEQNRRLIAAVLPAAFLAEHKAVVIENHLNMIRPLTTHPAVSPEVLAAFLNSSAADRAFRCVSGSVAVSAYELEALPLPDPATLEGLAALVRSKATRTQIEAECSRLYSISETE